MATSLGLKDASTRGTREVSPDSLLGTRKTFMDTYLVRADDSSETEDDAMGATDLPALYSISSGAFLVRKEAREIASSALLWEVDCHYDSQIDPSTKLVRVSIEVEEVETHVPFDQVTGAPIVNSVGEPLLVTAPISIIVLVIKRLESSYDLDKTLLLNNHTNSLPFWSAPIGTALMKGPTMEPQEVGGITRYMHTYRIKFNTLLNPLTGLPQGWLAHLLNQGTAYKEDADDDALVPFRNETDHSTGNLELDGTKRDPSQDGLSLAFNRFPRTNFNVDNLGPYEQ